MTQNIIAEYQVVVEDRRTKEQITRTITNVKNPDAALFEMRSQMTKEFAIPPKEYDEHYRAKKCIKINGDNECPAII